MTSMIFSYNAWLIQMNMHGTQHGFLEDTSDYLNFQKYQLFRGRNVISSCQKRFKPALNVDLFYSVSQSGRDFSIIFTSDIYFAHNYHALSLFVFL